MDLKEFFDWATLKDLRQGLGLTFRYMWTKPVTRLYPFEEFTPQPRWRGIHSLWRDAHNGEERCLGCCLCERICPNNSIQLVTGRAEDGTKEIYDFIVDGGRCLYCGLCEEVCPVRAIRQTKEFTVKVYCREDIIHHKQQLLDRGGQD